MNNIIEYYQKYLQQGHVDILDYEDIEIKYSDEIRQFYFLRIGLVFNPMGLIQKYYDIITGEVIEEQELIDNKFRYFSKKTILPEQKFYSVEELNVIYKKLLDNKELYVANELSENVTAQKIVYIDRIYESCDISLVYDLVNNEYKFIVTENRHEIYDAITGKIISKRELESYKQCDNSGIIVSGMQYPFKVLKIWLEELNNNYQKRL